ncbi:hypothetical protein ACF061_12620 [Streptomyces sp. NPDC015220]|uniref:hypothetical protein n=1 Tax=Streptomyces sp. NPDC015220 TaxID=3364947 RepID=UPI0036F4E177
MTRKPVVSLLTAAALAAGLAFAAASPASAVPCGTKDTSTTIDGGKAGYTLFCTGRNRSSLSGWVEDTRIDGKCAYLRIEPRTGSPFLRKACDYGTRKNFHADLDSDSAAIRLYIA